MSSKCTVAGIKCWQTCIEYGGVRHQYWFLRKEPQLRFDSILAITRFAEDGTMPRSPFVSEGTRKLIGGLGITRDEFRRIEMPKDDDSSVGSIATPPVQRPVKTSTPSFLPARKEEHRRILSSSKKTGPRSPYKRDEKKDDKVKADVNQWIAAKGDAHGVSLILDCPEFQSTTKALIAAGHTQIHVVEREIDEAGAKKLSSETTTWHAGELEDYLKASSTPVFDTIYIDGFATWEKLWHICGIAIQDKLSRSGSPVFAVTFCTRGTIKHASRKVPTYLETVLEWFYEIVDTLYKKNGNMVTVAYKLRCKF